MKRTATVLTIAALSGLAWLPLTGCASDSKEEKSEAKASKTAERNEKLQTEAAAAIGGFKSSDSTLDKFFRSSAGYAVFPAVSKGGAIIGGAGGDGVVYQNGNVVGYSELSQGSVGLQLGGQVYREIIFFETQSALDHFKGGHAEFDAQASAVAAKSGAAANASYKNGVAVFTQTNGGLMFEAGIGGQHFTYRPR